MLIILSAVTIKTVTDLKIIEFAIKGTEDYSKAQEKEMEDFGRIENLLTQTISNIESGNTDTNTGTEPSEPEEPIILSEADIGKYVNYVPVGIDYTVEAKYSGNTENVVFSQDTSLKWQIWKVENETIYLISDAVPSIGGYNNKGSLSLRGVQGYNNGVTLIDNICQANYGINGNSKVKVQNFKLEDLLSVKSDEIKPEIAYGTQPYTYPESGTSPFPSIWYNNERENLEVAQGNRSKAYPLVEVENSTTVSSNQKPYYTNWYNGTMNNVGAWKNEEYLKMVKNTINTKSYWFSSRFVNPGSSASCDFGLHSKGSNIVYQDNLYHCKNGSTTNTGSMNGIRPLVSIPLRFCEITENKDTENTFDIVIK